MAFLKFALLPPIYLLSLMLKGPLMRFALVLVMLACTLALTGCSASSESDSGKALNGEKARQLGGVTKLLACYTDEGGDKGYVCWVRFKDGTTCLRSQTSSDFYSYTDCRGGFAATLPPIAHPAQDEAASYDTFSER